MDDDKKQRLRAMMRQAASKPEKQVVLQNDIKHAPPAVPKTLKFNFGKPLVGIGVKTNSAGYLTEIGLKAVDSNFRNIANSVNLKMSYPGCNVKGLLDPATAAELVEHWYDGLPLNFNSPGTRKVKMIPVGFQYHLALPVLRDWLGPKTYDDLFFYGYRDPMAFGYMYNDAMSMRGYPVSPFMRDNLRFIASKVGYIDQHSSTALYKAMLCLEVYKRVLSGLQPMWH